jgi:uncharacterized protein (DUF305 family)
MNHRTLGLVTAVLLLTAGCGSGDSASAPVAASASSPAGTTATRHNATDVMFLQMMVAREQETARLTRLARSKDLPAEVSTLAAAIQSTQADEARTMAGWLRDWGRPAVMDPDAAAHSHHGGLESLSPADLAELGRAKPEDFPTRFLNLLIAQQHNAVELARMETTTGTHPGARDLARRIDQSRTAQIAAMLAMVADK